MTVSGPKIRDFTDRERSLPITIEADPIYELLLAIFVLQGGMHLDEIEEGSKLAELIDADGNARLREELETLRSCGELWLSLLGIAHDLPAPRTAASLAESLETMDPVALRRTLLHNVGIKPSGGFDAGTVDAAASGDPDAIASVFTGEHQERDLRLLMAMPPTESAALLASILRGFDAAAGEWLARVRTVLERDAASTRAMARAMKPAELVEKATNGITFEMLPHVSGILLIPSAIIRPWVVVSEHGSLRVFCYSVADEVLEGDLDAPPAYMVEVFKALGDERRLRILGVLAESELGLKEIAERMDLAKSTAHHHLRILRSAGLVRITVGDEDKRYGLRRDSVPEVGRLLEGFLATHGATQPRKDTA
jgi:DNA-binding transcriptional ArsR family regulator